MTARSLRTEAAPEGERFVIFCGEYIERWCAIEDVFNTDRDRAINAIASGEPVAPVTQIVAFDLSKGTCRDATDEIMNEVFNRWADAGEPISYQRYKQIELHKGIEFARGFQLEDEYA